MTKATSRSFWSLDEARDLDLRSNGFERWGWRERLSPASRCRIMRYQRRLRRLEDLDGRGGLAAVVRRVLWQVHARDAVALGFSIPPHSCGPGLSLAHYGSITINDDSRLGRDCRVHPGVVIGRSATGAPTIGDRCYIGAGAKIYGQITIGDEVVVAPNAVVTHDVANNSVVAGVPARVLRLDVPYEWRH